MSCGGVSPWTRRTPLSPASHPSLLKQAAVFQLGTSLLEVAGDRVGLEVKHVPKSLDGEDIFVVGLITVGGVSVGSRVHGC